MPSGRRCPGRWPLPGEPPRPPAARFDGLEVDVDRMRANLELSGGLVMAEQASFLLAEKLGRRGAQELVAEAAERSRAGGRSLREELGADLEAGLDPADYLGSAGVFVDRALTFYRDELGDRAVRLHHRFDGPADAPVLALPSSLGTTTELWDANVPAWSETFRVLRYDQRGHGGSEVPPGPYSIEDLGRDFVSLLDELGIERVSFCWPLTWRRDGHVAGRQSRQNGSAASSWLAPPPDSASRRAGSIARRSRGTKGWRRSPTTCSSAGSPPGSRKSGLKCRRAFASCW